MNQDLWRRISAAFDALCDLPAAARQERLESFEREDPELAGELRVMLRADGRESGVLARSPLDLDAAASAAISDQESAGPPVDGALAAGALLGPWRLVERLGAGGMGEVWTAERADGAFEQRVALKLLRRGLETEGVLRRFLRERQILARLTHPGIARLIDAGSTPDGRPYFVLERVEGQPITDHSRQRALSVEGRLRLLIQACGAVDFAHRNLVVHRDLKPSNVLVSERGEVKLLDFGIAKLLERDDGTQLTELDGRALTPAYAAPEQIRGEAVTTATDVYALGVLLYELLTGRLPYRRQSTTLPALLGDLDRETVKRPSVAVRSQPVGEPAAADTRRLARRLAGDLDTIALKALAREPERRYHSAAALAADLERHLDGRPLEARPDAVGYRLHKFVTRHAWAVSSAVAALILITALTAIYTVGVTRERDRARLERQKAERIAGFLSSLFELSDLDQTKGVPLSLREVVDRGAASLERDPTIEPEVAATLMGTIGRVYEQLDLEPKARPLLESALRLRRQQLGDDHPDVVRSERELGVLLHEMGLYSQARERLRHALAVEVRARGGQTIEVARIRTVLARLDPKVGGYAGAAAEFEKARAILERAGPEAEADLALTLASQGMMFLGVGEPERALVPLRRALEIRQRVLGPESPTTGSSMLNLAVALRATGDAVEAIALAERVRDVAARVLGERHSLHAYALGDLAMSWRARGDLARSLEMHQEAVEAFERLSGPDDSTVLRYRRSLAEVIEQQGDLRRALAEFEAILAIRQRVLRAEHRQIADSLFDVARLRIELGEPGDAEAAMRRGLEIYRLKLAPDSSDLAGSLVALGGYLCSHGKRSEGQPMLREALAVWTKNPSREAPDLAVLSASAQRCG